MKRLLMLAAALAMLALLSGTALAATPTVVNEPIGAPVIDNQPHVIGPNTVAWYRFNYAGDESLITVRMTDIDDQGIEFSVFAPNQIRDWWNEQPIGRGSAELHDLVWSGATPLAGTYYVKVENVNPYDKPFTLLVGGLGVGISPAPAPAMVKPPLENTDAASAALLDNAQHTIAPNSTRWYKYEFPNDHQQLIVRLPNGAAMGLEFRVFTGTQLDSWWRTDPFGVGNVEGNDLVWMTAEYGGELIYIQVVNANPYALQFHMEMQMDHLFE